MVLQIYAAIPTKKLRVVLPLQSRGINENKNTYWLFLDTAHVHTVYSNRPETLANTY